VGNLSKGVTSESAKVGATCPDRKSLADIQSLKPRPALSSGVCSRGIANAPSAITGVSFSNSRRVRDLNLRPSIREFIDARIEHSIGFAGRLKVTSPGWYQVPSHSVSGSVVPAAENHPLELLQTTVLVFWRLTKIPLGISIMG